MIRKKSSFLTFCFAIIPGAGQMYLGFMKRGVSLMSVFFLITLFASWLHTAPLMYIAPIIWFYAFFDALNLRAMPDDEFYALEDNYIIIPDISTENMQLIRGKYRNIFAVLLIIIGFFILWNNFFDMIDDFLPYYIRNLLYRSGRFIPQLLVGIAIIALGIYLIRGKKRDLDKLEPDPFLEDKGGR